MIDAEERDPLRGDPRYDDGLAHLQAGRWQEAIDAFEALARDFPDDAAVRRALEDARFRARQDQRGRVRARRSTVRVGPIIVRILLIGIIAVVAYYGYQFVQTQVRPALAQAQVDRQRNLLERECAAFFEAGELDKAQERCTELLIEEPGSATAETVLGQIAEQRALSELYIQAVALQEASEYAGALELYTEISVRQPRYRDVSLRISTIRRQQELDRLFAEAEADYQAGMYDQALVKYETLEAAEVRVQDEGVRREGGVGNGLERDRPHEAGERCGADRGGGRLCRLYGAPSAQPYQPVARLSPGRDQEGGRMDEPSRSGRSGSGGCTTPVGRRRRTCCRPRTRSS